MVIYKVGDVPEHGISLQDFKHLIILGQNVEESCTGTFQIGGEVINALALSAVDRGQTIDYKISIC